MNKNIIIKKMLGEFIGCFFLGSVGLMSIYQNIVFGGSVVEIAITFGLCIALAIAVMAPISGAMISPAFTIAQAIFKRFPIKEVIPYIFAQIMGWFLGALLIIAMCNESLYLWENTMGIVRGTASDVYSAQIFMCNMPNMLFASSLGAGLDSGIQLWPVWACILNETLGTLILTFATLVYSDPRNRMRPSLKSVPLMSGFVLAMLIGTLLVGSSACLNPARDLGPRLALKIFGWESAFPGFGWNNGGNWWIWWLCTIGGAILGEIVYEYIWGKIILDNELEDK